MIIIPFISLLGYSFFLGRIAKTDYYRHIITSISLIMIALYVFNVENEMLITSKIILLFGLNFFWFFLFTSKSVIKIDSISKTAVLISIILLIGFESFLNYNKIVEGSGAAMSVFQADYIPYSSPDYQLSHPITYTLQYFIISNSYGHYKVAAFVLSKIIVISLFLFYILTIIPNGIKYIHKVILSSIFAIPLFYIFSTVPFLELFREGILLGVLVSMYITAKNKIDTIIGLLPVSSLMFIVSFSNIPIVSVTIALMLTARWTKKEYFLSTIEMLILIALSIITAYSVNELTGHQINLKEQYALSSGCQYFKTIMYISVGSVLGLSNTILTFVNLKFTQVPHEKQKKSVIIACIISALILPIFHHKSNIAIQISTMMLMINMGIILNSKILDSIMKNKIYQKLHKPIMFLSLAIFIAINILYL